MKNERRQYQRIINHEERYEEDGPEDSKDDLAVGLEESPGQSQVGVLDPNCKAFKFLNFCEITI